MTEVVSALIWDKDKFLICQRPANKARVLLWEFFGGKVESPETKEQALVRECSEELVSRILLVIYLWTLSTNTLTVSCISPCSVLTFPIAHQSYWSIII